MKYMRVLAFLGVLATVGLAVPLRAIAQTTWDRTIVSATTRDNESGGSDGFIDHIEIRAPAALVDSAPTSYNNVRVEVENYLVNGVDTCGIPNDELFCARVARETIFDTGARPRVRVVNGGGLTLATSGTAPQTEVIAEDGAAPIMGYTLAMAGRNEIYIRFSEPVYGESGTVLNDATAFTLMRADPLTILRIRNGDGGTGGNQNVLLVLRGDVETRHVYSGTNPPQITVASSNSIFDAEGNPLSVPPSMPISSLVLGDAENLLLQPTIAYNTLAPDESVVAGATQPAVGVLRTFDGSRSIASAGALTLQIFRGRNIIGIPRIIAGINVDPAFVRNGLWLPILIPDLVPAAYMPSINDAIACSNNCVVRNTGSVSNDLVEYTITEAQIDRVENSFQFLISDGNESNTNYFATVTEPNSETWYTSVRPYAFVFRQPSGQQAGISILNNVINPLTNQRTAIQYRLDQAETVNITVFNLAGDIVRVLQRGRQGAGNHIVEWDGRNSRGRVVARGIYFIRFVSSDTDEYRKVIIIK